MAALNTSHSSHPLYVSPVEVWLTFTH